MTTATVLRHYKSCGNEFKEGKERLKRKAFKRPRKTDLEGADVMR